MTSKGATSNWIKICGIRDSETARHVGQAGADFIGFIFPPSRRQVTWKTALEAGAEAKARSSSGHLRTVGVFVTEPAAEIVQIASAANLDIVQLPAGHPEIEHIAAHRQVIASFRPRPDETADAVAAQIAIVIERVQPLAILFDAYDPTAAGGTGRLADWKLVHELTGFGRTILAGGLEPENIGQAIEIVRPAGVDVSSGVETDGVKDPEKLYRFITNARRHFAGVVPV